MSEVTSVPCLKKESVDSKELEKKASKPSEAEIIHDDLGSHDECGDDIEFIEWDVDGLEDDDPTYLIRKEYVEEFGFPEEKIDEWLNV
jgi:hypothetical protein